MVLRLPYSYDVVNAHHHIQQNQIVHYSNAVVYGGEIDSIRRSFTSAALHHSNCDYFNSDQMPDELIRPDYDPNQPSSSSIDPNANDDSWLRLRLGSDDLQSSSSTLDTRRGSVGGVGSGVLELDLIPSIPNTSQSHHHQQQQVISTNTRPPGFLHTPEYRAPPRPVALNWALMRPSNIIGGNYYMTNPNPTTATASMSLMMSMGPNFFTRPNFSGATQMRNNGGGEGMSSSSGMRIIRPPRRENVGVWLMLQASRNQITEPFLPQIPKSYLRIKNGHMTIRLLMKYLVQKLGLDCESEVEIRCRGQELEPILTLQHVRDSIWCTRRDSILNFHTDSPSSSTSSGVPTDHHSHIMMMILQYGRRISSAAAATTTGRTTAAAPRSS